MACIGGGLSEGVCRICSHTPEHMAVEGAHFRTHPKDILDLAVETGDWNIQIWKMNPLHLPVAISLKLKYGCATSRSPIQDIDTDYHGAGEKLAAMVDSRHGSGGGGGWTLSDLAPFHQF